jgi:hypothetical protein
VLLGAGIAEPLAIESTLPHSQAVGLVWVAAAALIGAWAAARLVRAAAAPVAAATFLFSPFGAMMCLFVGPTYLGTVLTALLVVALLGVYERRSPLALVAAASVAGMSATFPALWAIAYPAFALALAIALRARPRLPPVAIATAVLSFAAFVLPGLPELVEVGAVVEFYRSEIGHWTTIESAFRTSQSARAGGGGDPGAFDALLGSALAPFATPRTPLRLWADSLFDPLGTVLAAVGIASCLKRPNPRSLALVALLALSVIEGAFSSYDRASLLRLPALPLPMALLAAAGFTSLIPELARRSPGRAAPLVCALAIAVGGLVQVRLVNPRLLARSATGTAIEVLAAADQSRSSLFVLPRGWAPQSTPWFVPALVDAPSAWVGYDGPTSLVRADDEPAADLFFWSPGLEQRSAIARDVCAHWPEAALYEMVDAAGLARAFAAAPLADGWRPALPDRRWSVGGCDRRLPTEASRARAAIDAADRLATAGKLDEAIDLLDRAARQTFVQIEVFDTLARMLLTRRRDRTDVARAVLWAERAVQTSGSCVAGAVETLAAAHRADGREAEASRTLDHAGEQQRTTCRYDLLDGHPWKAPDTVGNGTSEAMKNSIATDPSER